jgi:hypothetical protein
VRGPAAGSWESSCPWKRLRNTAWACGAANRKGLLVHAWPTAYLAQQLEKTNCSADSSPANAGVLPLLSQISKLISNPTKQILPTCYGLNVSISVRVENLTLSIKSVELSPLGDDSS